jgi:dihydroorotase
MALDMKIVGGTLVLNGQEVRAGLGIKGGRVAQIAADDYIAEAGETIDATGRHVLPGAIDAHVHTRDPGYPDEEDFETATQSAAAGGVTTIIDMPGTDIPMLANVAALENKVRTVTRRAYVDFALRGGVFNDNLDDLVPLAEAGVVAYKVRTVQKTLDTPIIPDGTLFEAFKKVASTGRPMGIHAESGHVVNHLIDQLKAAGRHDALAHYESRPEFVEVDTVARAILFARETGSRLFIHHIGAAEVADQIRAARAAGQDVTGETCPHYLIFSTEDYERLGLVAKVSPSIKTPADREGLWEALLDGTIDILASDHAPHPPAQKLVSSVWNAASGFPGVETIVPLMLDQVAGGRLPLARFVDATAERPARIFGFYPRKGSLAIGSDADAMIVDLAGTWTIDQARLHTKSKISPYDGQSGRGRVEVTILRGAVVARDGGIVGRPRGEWLRP